MPFALIPEGYKLQKVTKLQKEAVDKFYTSQNVDSFLDGQASGELVKAVAIVVTPIVLAALAKQGFDDLPSLEDLFEKIPGFDLSALGEFSP